MIWKLEKEALILHPLLRTMVHMKGRAGVRYRTFVNTESKEKWEVFPICFLLAAFNSKVSDSDEKKDEKNFKKTFGI